MDSNDMYKTLFTPQKPIFPTSLHSHMPSISPPNSIDAPLSRRDQEQISHHDEISAQDQMEEDEACKDHPLDAFACNSDVSGGSENSPQKKDGFYSVSSPASNNGRWTNEEHLQFVKGLALFGKNWKKIEEFLGTRSGAQIRSHAQKFFNKVQRESKNEKKSPHQLSNSNNNHRFGRYSNPGLTSPSLTSMRRGDENDHMSSSHPDSVLGDSGDTQKESEIGISPEALKIMEDQLQKIQVFISILSAYQDVGPQTSGSSAATTCGSPTSPSSPLTLPFSLLSLEVVQPPPPPAIATLPSLSLSSPSASVENDRNITFEKSAFGTPTTQVSPASNKSNSSGECSDDRKFGKSLFKEVLEINNNNNNENTPRHLKQDNNDSRTILGMASVSSFTPRKSQPPTPIVIPIASPTPKMRMKVHQITPLDLQKSSSGCSIDTTSTDQVSLQLEPSFFGYLMKKYGSILFEQKGAGTTSSSPIRLIDFIQPQLSDFIIENEEEKQDKVIIKSGSSSPTIDQDSNLSSLKRKKESVMRSQNIEKLEDRYGQIGSKPSSPRQPFFKGNSDKTNSSVLRSS